MDKKFIVILLACALPGLSRVTDIYLRDMVNIADVIVLATVNHIEMNKNDKWATAIVKMKLKGNSSDTLFFQANPTWTCDISDAKNGESAIYFLTKPLNKKGFRKIVISGRGRIPLIFAGQDTLVNVQISVICPWDLLSHSKIDTLQTKHSSSDGVRSIPLNLFISKVTELMQTKYDFTPKRFIPPPDYDVYHFIENNNIKEAVDLQTLYDGIPRVGNDEIILEYLYGTMNLTDIKSKEFKKRLRKIFPDIELVIEGRKLVRFEKKN